MKIIDISWPISEQITGYRDRKEVQYTWLNTFPAYDHRLSSISLNSHTGTHIDAPSHFIKDGQHIENYTLDQLIGNCRVLDLTSCSEMITKADLEPFGIRQGEIILLKTQNSFVSTNEPFKSSFIYLEMSGAQFLAQKGIKAVGIDYLGVERNQPDRKTHISLLSKNIPIIEGLRLKEVQSDTYFLCCLPLAIHGLEAAPARAVLISQ